MPCKTRLMIAAAGVALLSSGCAVDPARAAEWSAAWEKVQNTRPTCADEKDCSVKWDAAQIWVSQHADMKIQLATSALIETYNSPELSTRLHISVEKRPLGQGRYQLFASADCSLPDACWMTRPRALQSFNDYISTITP